MRIHRGSVVDRLILLFGVVVTLWGQSFIGSPASNQIAHVSAHESQDLTEMLPAAGLQQPSAAPEEAARSFYKWYLHALYQTADADPFKEHKTQVEKYVTARLLQKLENLRRTSTVRKGPDVDTEYFFGTLDLDSDWEKDVTVSALATRGVTVVIHVSLSGRGESRQDLKVVLKEESGVWKIDSVEIWRQ
jgi:hypothetical protein